MNNHIFIIHTAFQEFIAESAALLIKKDTPTDKFILASEIKITKRTSSIWDNTIQLQNITPSSFGKHKTSLYNENLLKLNKAIQTPSQTTFYISDIQWPMNNRLFFDKGIAGEFNFSMIIDGTLAYYNPKKNLYNFARDTLKYVAGVFGKGLPYHPYLGSVMGWERARVSKVYGLNLKLSPIHPEKHINIEEVICKTAQLDKNKSIFLDQPFHNNMTSGDIKSLTTDTLNFFEQKSIKNIHYKAHHFSKEEYKNTFNFDKNKILQTTECIERIIQTYGFGTIISYNSTALFTLKTIYKDNIRCISLRDKRSRMNINITSAKKIDELFYNSGVELHEIG